MLITASAYIKKCSCEGDHYATIHATDGSVYPFLTIHQGKESLCDLLESEVISLEEWTFLSSEIMRLNLPASAEEMAKSFGVTTDVMEETCFKAAIYIQKIMSRDEDVSNLPVM